MRLENRLKSKMRLFLIKYFVLTVVFLQGQDFRKDIFSVSNYMNRLEKYSYGLKYYLYVDLNLKVPHDTRTVFIKKDKFNFYMQQPAAFELIENENEHLKVDHLNKLMLYAKINHSNPEPIDEVSDPKELLKMFDQDYDSLSKIISKVSMKHQNSDYIIYMVEFTDGIYTKMLMTINTKRNLLSYVTVFYRNKRPLDKEDKKVHAICLKVDYIEFSTDPVFNKETFSTSRFIVKNKNGDIVLKPELKDYQLQIL